MPAVSGADRCGVEGGDGAVGELGSGPCAWRGVRWVCEVSAGMTLPVIGADPGPLARLEAVKADPQVPQVVFQRMTNTENPERLRDIAKSWGLPQGMFVLWFTTQHSELYDQALRVRAGELVLDALEVADEQKEAVDRSGNKYDPDVGRDKLRVETRLKIASSWDRARYGTAKEQAAGGGVTVVVDRSCGGTVAIEAPGGSKVVVGNSGAEASTADREGVI